MAKVAIRTQRPSLHEVAAALSEAFDGAPRVTWATVLAAAKARDVTVKDGRVENRDVSALYFESMYLLGALERPTV